MYTPDSDRDFELWLPRTTTSGAKTTLTFQGENVEVYGSIGELYSQFDVSVDSGAAETLDCHNDESRSSVLLWSANSLGDGLHKLEITNRSNGTSQNKLELGYALVRSATKGIVLSGYIYCLRALRWPSNLLVI
jgi:hypothetical protein